MQRGQGNEFLQVGKNLCSYPHGARVIETTVDHAMTNASQAHLIAEPK